MLVTSKSIVCPSVSVAIATYNGARYIKEQLDSILTQTHSVDEIIIVDDCSSDETWDILTQHATNNSKIKIFRNETNLGGTKSFEKAICACHGDYIALADQDDYWLPEKLISAANKLDQQSKNKPLLYCSALEFVDKDLVHLGMSNLNFKPSFGNALVENIVTGCTAVFNNSLKKLAKNYKPQQAVMHDWWLYLLATAFGRVIYDPISYIKYRQHGANVIGATPSFMYLWRRRLTILWQAKPIVSTLQAAEFYQYYHQHLSTKNLELAKKFVERRSNSNARWFIVYSALIYKQNSLDTIAMKLLIALGWY